MDIQTRLKALVGDWQGISRLWLTPDDPVRECETSATGTLVAGGGFLTIAYNWAYQGAPHDGVLLVRLADEPGDLSMVWIDSWHTEGKFMTFRGEAYADGQLSAVGSYSAPEGPDWGWRIVVAANPGGGFALRMYNIPPDSGEELAVEAHWQRIQTIHDPD
jgi:hypothetical protein